MSAVPVMLEPVGARNEPVLRELLNLYLYDLSHLAAADPDRNGRFEYPFLDGYWTEPERHAFFAVAAGVLAGFVLINAHSETDAEHSIAECFVLKRHRRSGVGRAAAWAAFDRFRGSWEVCTDAENQAAIAFWRDTIASYTRGSFQERAGIGGWTGPMFLFEGRSPG